MVAGQRANEIDFLVDKVEPAAKRDIMRLGADEWVRHAKRREQGPRLDERIARVAGDGRLGPGIGQLAIDRQPFGPGAEAVPDLDDLLFLEVERRISRNEG